MCKGVATLLEPGAWSVFCADLCPALPCPALPCMLCRALLTCPESSCAVPYYGPALTCADLLLG